MGVIGAPDDPAETGEHRSRADVRWCSRCGGTACEYNCGRDGDREGCERGSTAAYGPDAHRVCTLCGGYPPLVEDGG